MTEKSDEELREELARVIQTSLESRAQMERVQDRAMALANEIARRGHRRAQGLPVEVEDKCPGRQRQIPQLPSLAVSARSAVRAALSSTGRFLATQPTADEAEHLLDSAAA